MGLSSVFSTAITGLTAAETTIDVVGNNVANASTVGFKQSEAQFATQFLQSLSLGSAPTEGRGGTNPRQIGLGAQVAAVTPDFTQGTIEISSKASDLAIQGDGFFIVQAPTGESLYTRNGMFSLNSSSELVTTTGHRLLGFGVDDQFQIEPTTLVSLTIPLGSAAVAQATQNVFLEGTLTPTGDIANVAEILQTGILSDAQYARPEDAVSAATVPTTPTGSGVGDATGGVLTGGATYQYRLVYADGPVGSATDTEGVASTTFSVTLGGGDDAAELTLPVTASSFSHLRIYRTTAGGTDFHFLDEVTVGTANYTDEAIDDVALVTAPQIEAANNLNGIYTYYITYGEQISPPGTPPLAPPGLESRPSPISAPVTIVNGRIQLTDLPVDTSGDWVERRIYRSAGNATDEFYLVGVITNNLPNQTFTDNLSDADLVTHPTIDFNGPPISAGATRLVDLVTRTGDSYTNLFSETGTLQFTGRKGNRELDTKELTITGTTTVLDLMNFMDQALGIRSTNEDPTNPIPIDSGSGNPPGITVTSDSRIRIVSNNGLDNAVDIGLSSFQLRGASGLQSINLPFNTTQQAVGQTAVTDFVVFDSLGVPLNVRLTMALENRTSTETVYRWYADSVDNDPLTGVQISVGTGLIRFDGNGDFLSATNDTAAIERQNIPSATPLEFRLDFGAISGLAAQRSTVAATRQDGFPPGQLTSYIIGEDGTIRGVFDNGTERTLGQIRLARFANPAGLEQRGENLFATGVNSGLPVVGDPGAQGIGSIIAGAVELSNTDIGSNLIDLILASTQYRGNARVITSAQQLLDELLNLRR